MTESLERRNSDVSRDVPPLALISPHHHTQSLSSQRNTHRNTNSLFLLIWVVSASLASFLLEEWRVDIRIEEPAPAESHRS